MQFRLSYVMAALWFAMPGCLYHSYYPNGYYGPTPVMMPGGQPYNAYPATPMYQPGTPVYQPATPGFAPGTSPTPLNGGNQPTFTPSDPNSNPQTYGAPGSNNSPTFNPNPNPAPNNSRDVPNPGDDNNSSDYNRGSSRSPLSPTTGAMVPSDLSTPFNQPESRLPRNFPNDSSSDTYAAFERPMVQPDDGRGNNIQQVNNQNTTGRPAKTYAHHPRFNWVQGVVEYDEPSNTWVIMYDDNPGTSDPYGGELTIAGDLSRARLRSGDTVRLEGGLDQTEQDARGRPLFAATKLEKL